MDIRAISAHSSPALAITRKAGLRGVARASETPIGFSRNQRPGKEEYGCRFCNGPRRGEPAPFSRLLPRQGWRGQGPDELLILPVRFFLVPLETDVPGSAGKSMLEVEIGWMAGGRALGGVRACED